MHIQKLWLENHEETFSLINVSFSHCFYAISGLKVDCPGHVIDQF